MIFNVLLSVIVNCKVVYVLCFELHFLYAFWNNAHLHTCCSFFTVLFYTHTHTHTHTLDYGNHTKAYSRNNNAYTNTIPKILELGL